MGPSPRAWSSNGENIDTFNKKSKILKKQQHYVNRIIFQNKPMRTKVNFQLKKCQKSPE